MRGKIINLNILFILFLSPVFAHGGPESEDNYQKSTLSFLFSPMMLFKNREPLVTVMIAREQKELLFSNGCRLEYPAANGKKLVRIISPKDKFRVKIARRVKGRVKFHLVVGSVNYPLDEDGKNFIKQWRQRGFSVKLIEVGSLFALGGKVLDNRRYYVSIKESPRAKSVASAMQKIFIDFGHSPFIYKALIKPPNSSFEVQSLNRDLRLSASFFKVVSCQTHLAITQPKDLASGDKKKNGKYRGQIILTSGSSGLLTAVNLVKVEDLLKGVVAAEIFASASENALKAQAIAARGMIFSKLGREHATEPYHFCNLQHCQVYGGLPRETPATSAAVEATRGELVVQNNRVVQTVYSSCCGGHTEDNHQVWPEPPSKALQGKIDIITNPEDYPGPLPFAPTLLPVIRHYNRQLHSTDLIEQWLDISPPSFCRYSKYFQESKFRWQNYFSQQEMERALKSKFKFDRLQNIQIVDRADGGRITGLNFLGQSKRVSILRELPVRKFLNNLNSGMFTIQPVKEKNSPVKYLVKGGGWGHGVGMCQQGAMGMAELGFNYKQILHHYFSETLIQKYY